TTDLEFLQTAGSATYTAGSGLNLNGTTFSVDNTIAKKTDIKDGQFTVSGTGALTGSGSMTANQSGNTTASIDLTQATKDKINNGVQDLQSVTDNGSSTDNPLYFENGFNSSGVSYLGDASPTSFNSGIYIKTNVSSDNISFSLTVEGGGNTRDINKIIINGYKSSDLDGVPNTFKVISFSPSFTKVDYVVDDGYLCFWIKPGFSSSSFSPKAKLGVGYYAPKDSRIISIEPKSEPTEGVDNVTTVESYTPEIIATEDWVNAQSYLKSVNLSSSLSGNNLTVS